MILYHFTAMENVEAIQRDGLRASCRGRMIAPPFSAPATSLPST